MTFFWHKDFKSLKITQFGAVGGPEWRLGGQKVGFTPWLIRRVCPTGTSTLLPKEPQLEKCQLRHTYGGSMQKTGNVRPQLWDYSLDLLLLRCQPLVL
eukprot:1160622-Pelagomonas_calceolata.AAC.10